MSILYRTKVVQIWYKKEAWSAKPLSLRLCETTKSSIPDLAGKVLVLESFGGLLPQMITLLTQLSQMNGFDRLNGIIIGEFTKLDSARQRETLLQEVLRISGRIPVAVTTDVGHDKLCKCIMIGEKIDIID